MFVYYFKLTRLKSSGDYIFIHSPSNLFFLVHWSPKFCWDFQEKWGERERQTGSEKLNCKKAKQNKIMTWRSRPIWTLGHNIPITLREQVICSLGTIFRMFGRVFSNFGLNDHEHLGFRFWSCGFHIPQIWMNQTPHLPCLQFFDLSSPKKRDQGLCSSPPLKQSFSWQSFFQDRSC